jgi:RHS repeat-associated protein
MAGISDQAALKPENFFKYNGKELQHKEFSDGSGLEEYDYGARMYDQQIGRFGTIDRLADLFQNITPYQYGSDNPLLYVDINGDSVVPVNQVVWPNFDVNNNQIGLNEVTITATSNKKQDANNMSLSDEGLAFIEAHEGFGKHGINPYNDSRHFATAGFGHLLHESPVTLEDIAKYKNLTRADALTLLKKDLQKLEPQIRAVVLVPLSQNEYDAIVSFTFNVGIGTLKHPGLIGSAFLRSLNSGKYDGTLMLHFYRPDDIMGRREDEVSLFDDGLYLDRGAPLNNSTLDNSMLQK